MGKRGIGQREWERRRGRKLGSGEGVTTSDPMFIAM